MHIRTLAAAAAAAAVLASGGASAREATGLEGAWLGALIAQNGESARAELTLDDYGCYALSIKLDRGVEIGFYEVRDGLLYLKTTKGDPRFTFRVSDDKAFIELDPKSVERVPEGCCTLRRR